MAGVAILVIGVKMVLDGDFTVGMVFAFQGLLSSFLAPLNQLVGVGQSFIGMRTEMERVEDVMNYRPDANAPPLEDLEAAPTSRKLSGALEIRNVAFGYSRLAEPLIKDFSLSVKRGSSVAIVGASGAASHPGCLLPGFAVWAGMPDGKPRRDRPHLSQLGGLVDQDITLFGDRWQQYRLWDTRSKFRGHPGGAGRRHAPGSRMRAPVNHPVKK
jgi:hypothetical protein